MSIKQLASIPESLLKHKVLKAMDYERVDEDWSTEFHIDDTIESVSYLHYKDSGWRGFIWHDGGGSRIFEINELKPIAIWPAGTPTGDALRLFLRRWGWVPAKERSVTEAQENTKTII